MVERAPRRGRPADDPARRRAAALRRAGAADRLARAGRVHDHARGRGAAPLEPETAFEKRERLRAERSALVGTIARRTGEEHRVINARVNREVGAASVNKSTDDQLERANRLLEKEVNRRRG